MRSPRSFVYAASLLVVCGLLSACSGSSKTLSGLGDYTETDCAFTEVATELSLGEDPFACRGKIWALDASYVTVARDTPGAPFSVALLDPKTAAPIGDVQKLPHTTTRPRGLPIAGGVLLYSTQKSKLIMTRHALPSGTFEEKIIDFDREISAVAALPASGSNPAMIAVATEVMVHTLYLNAEGTIQQRRAPLEMAEVPYCSEIFLNRKGSAVELALRCEAIRPVQPMNGDLGVFVIPGFDEESDDLPDASDILVVLDEKGIATESKVVDVNDPAPPPTPEGYALKQYMKQNLPRPLGYRAHVLSAVHLGEKRVLMLSCIGPDIPDSEDTALMSEDGTPLPKSRLQTGVLECKNPPVSE